MEAKLDKELERILGRAVTMDDLDALYQQDLKLLNQIEAGLSNKIGHFKQIIAALYVQKAWRGFVARKKVTKFANFKAAQTEEERRLRAAIYI